MSEHALAAQARAASAGDYLALLKPRVMALVVFTGAAGFVAAPGEASPVLMAAALIAIAFGAGGAGAVNMAYDADIDAKMRRTRLRPVPAGRAPTAEAYGLGIVACVLAVILMALSGGPIAAALLAFAAVFYAVVYTMWLKRRTPQNIVIGGLAGALPPAIGWAAAGGSPLDLNPWLMVALIFFWTPPHFWALALYQRGDYAAAGVPMLPVTHGPAATRAQILGYSLLVVPLGLAPALTGLGGLLYTAVAAGAGLVFLVLALRVARSRAGEDAAGGEGALYAVRRGDAAARDLFAFSILYLALLFAALLAEHGLGMGRAFGGGA